jgi:hypothetical protein
MPMEGAVRNASAALLGASSHARKPPTNNSAEGVSKEEDLKAVH